MTNQLFSRTGVRYEVALDVLGAIISHYSEVIGIEREKASPDAAVIDAAQNAKADLRTIREDLDPKSEDDIERVIAQYGPQARALYQ